jgi:drug/metabolite transporter (DMT)-like permease
VRRSGREQSWRAYGALGAAILGIVWSSFFIRWAAVPGRASAFYRVLIAGAVLVPVWLARRPPVPSRGAAALALGGGAFFGLDLALYNTAVLQTKVANATLLGNNAPLFVGLGTWLLFHRRLRAAFWLGLGLALGGCAAIVAGDARSAQLSSAHATGDLLALTAAVFFAGYLLVAERVREEMDTFTFNTLAIVGSVLTLLVICVATGAPLWGYSARTWGALLGLGLISQLGAYFALVYALGHLPATITSIGLLAQVPLTALLAIPLLGESVSGLQMVGGIVVLAGIYVVNRGTMVQRAGFKTFTDREPACSPKTW